MSRNPGTPLTLTMPSPSKLPEIRNRLTPYKESSSELSQLEKIGCILSLPIRERTTSLLSSVHSYTKDLKFFKNLEEETSEDFHSECLKFFFYEFYPPGPILIPQKQLSERKYVVLSGRVTIYKKSFKKPNQVITTFETGDCIDEKALKTYMTQDSTLKCVNECHIAYIRNQDYLEAYDEFFQTKFKTIATFLRSFSVNKNPTNNQVRNLSFYFKTKKYPRKSYVFKEGDLADCIYIIQEGEFQLWQSVKLNSTISSPHSIKSRSFSKKYPIATLVANELIGDEDIIMGNISRIYSCQCISETGVLLVTSKENFKNQALKTEEAKEFIQNRIMSKIDYRRATFNKQKQLQELTTPSSKSPPNLEILSAKPNSSLSPPKQKSFNFSITRSPKSNYTAKRKTSLSTPISSKISNQRLKLLIGLVKKKPKVRTQKQPFVNIHVRDMKESGNKTHKFGNLDFYRSKHKKSFTQFNFPAKSKQAPN